MIDRRSFLRHGDITSTGGVLFATGKGKFGGIQAAVEGDWATCHACGSIGRVLNDCYPAFAPGGIQVPVEGARVYCRCANPPVCLASQSKDTVVVNRNSLPAPSMPAHALHDKDGTKHSEEEDILEQYYELVDADTGEPAPGYRYDLLTNGNCTSQDAALTDGRSVVVRGALSTGIVIWLDKSQEVRA